MISKWKCKDDEVWSFNTGMLRYLEAMKPNVNVHHCKQFVVLLWQQTKDDLTNAGVVDGVLFQYSRNYLHTHFGGNGIGFMKWTKECQNPRPSKRSSTTAATSKRSIITSNTPLNLLTC